MIGRLVALAILMLAPTGLALGPVPYRICDGAIQPGYDCDEVAGGCTIFGGGSFLSDCGGTSPMTGERLACIGTGTSPKYWCGVSDVWYRCAIDVEYCRLP